MAFNVIQKCVSVPSFEFLPYEERVRERPLELERDVWSAIGNRHHPVFSYSQRRLCEERVAAKRERERSLRKITARGARCSGRKAICAICPVLEGICSVQSLCCARDCSRTGPKHLVALAAHPVAEKKVSFSCTVYANSKRSNSNCNALHVTLGRSVRC